MIHAAPRLSDADHSALDRIAATRRALAASLRAGPEGCAIFLRRLTRARALVGTLAVEGCEVDLDAALASVDGEVPRSAESANFRPLAGLCTAHAYIDRLAADPAFEPHPQFLRTLHVVMLGHDPAVVSGQWRDGAAELVDPRDGATVCVGPPSAQVPELMHELSVALAAPPGPAAAALAHLNLATILPFRDGNERLARAIQTLVLARMGDLDPALAGIEDWLGGETAGYYAGLRAAAGAAWRPQADAGSWVRFCLAGQQGQLDRLAACHAATVRVWTELAARLGGEDLPARAAPVLLDAAFGLTVRNGRYRAETGLSDVGATRDLHRLCDAGMLVALGEKRGRVYRLGPSLTVLAARARVPAG